AGWRPSAVPTPSNGQGFRRVIGHKCSSSQPRHRYIIEPSAKALPAREGTGRDAVPGRAGPGCSSRPGGQDACPGAVLRPMGLRERQVLVISEVMPYQKRFLEVSGHAMAYVGAGRGNPIVFLPGHPTTAYPLPHDPPALQPG